MIATFETPILFLIFNRPSETAKVWERIREIQPRNLYIAADGPRVGNEADQAGCSAVRKIVSEIDWECKPHYLLRDENLGCGRAINSAITWFFENVPFGIILEDDCLPQLDFFTFCADLLQRYQNDERIFMISGSSVPGKYIARTDSDYLFTAIPSAWGWASWRRSWNRYDFQLESLEDFERSGAMDNIFSKSRYRKYWLDYFHEIKNRKINNWDYQLAFSAFKCHGLCLRPRNNLVLNLGTTTLNGRIKFIQETQPLKLTSHPNDIARDINADEAIMKELTAPLHNLKRLLKKLGIFYMLKKLYRKL